MTTRIGSFSGVSEYAVVLCPVIDRLGRRNADGDRAHAPVRQWAVQAPVPVTNAILHRNCPLPLTGGWWPRCTDS